MFKAQPSAGTSLGLMQFASPFHPIFVHFTIGLTATSWVFDAAARWLDHPSLASAAWWMLLAALPATAAALISGLISRRRLAIEEGDARRWLRAHMTLGPIFFGLLIAAAVWRSSFWQSDARPSWAYLASCGGVVLVMTVQGYLGGELVYRFGMEVRGGYPRLPNAR